MPVDRKELILNATHWMNEFKRANVQKLGIGAMFVFFNREDPTGSAICVASINKEGVKDACRGILKKVGSDPDSRIISPHET